jgi:GNAT superfamily N-acetyltransferase/predicted nuclease of restriction endonuclease-like (RecB) superfamily
MTKNIITTEYQKFVADLKERVASSRYKAALSVNKELILLYHHIGTQILEAQSKQGWGAKVLDQLSRDLRSEFPDMKGFSPQNLKYMRKFAEEYKSREIGQQPVDQLHFEKIIIRESTLSDASEVAAIHVKAWQESYKNIIEEHYLQNISFSDRLELRNKILNNNDPNQIHWVAVYEEKIIGFCDAGPAFENTADYFGEIYAIYLLEEFKRCGIGQRLLQAAHKFLSQKKLLPYVAWVLKDNPSGCAFYKKNGGILSGEKIEEIGNKLYSEVAYILSSSINIRPLYINNG